MAVLATASSKYCSLNSQHLWDLSWDEFITELEFSQIQQAGDTAAQRDAATKVN